MDGHEDLPAPSDGPLPRAKQSHVPPPPGPPTPGHLDLTGIVATAGAPVIDAPTGDAGQGSGPPSSRRTTSPDAPEPVSIPITGAGPPRERYRGLLLGLGVLICALLGVLVVILLFERADQRAGPGDSVTIPASNPTSTAETTTTTSTTVVAPAPIVVLPPATVPAVTGPTAPPTTEPISPDAWAALELSEQADEDRSEIDSLIGDWVPQVSAKAPGLKVDGITYDNARVLSDHLAYRGRYPNARLLKTDSLNFNLSGYWVTVIAETFSSSDEANAWCDREGLAANDCFAKRLRYGPSTKGDVDYRDR